jgi:hypothetical protein
MVNPVDGTDVTVAVGTGVSDGADLADMVGMGVKVGV